MRKRDKTVIDYNLYEESIQHPFVKLCRLRFLNNDGTTAFAIDNGYRNRYKTAFLADGSISVNLQNGQRRSASVTLDNAGQEFEYSVNKLWFGQQVALDEGLVLLNGSEEYFPQGVFLIANPSEELQPTNKVVRLNLVDKWANLDGTLYGNLEGTYEVESGINIFKPIAELLREDRGNGVPVDPLAPVFTNYYNKKTQALPDGSSVSLTDNPCTLTVESGTLADVILGLAGRVNGWVGYNAIGRLCVDASQDDINDAAKPVEWTFSMADTNLLGLTYDIRNTEVYNDYIVVGEQTDGYPTPSARVQNVDPASDTSVQTIGRKTYRESAAGFATTTQCLDLARWRLKRAAVLHKAVSISCSQLFHINENELVRIERADKPGNPTELHVVQGFSRPLASTGEMTISAISTVDYPELAVVEEIQNR